MARPEDKNKGDHSHAEERPEARIAMTMTNRETAIAALRLLDELLPAFTQAPASWAVMR
jgi:hypothetical protein